MDPEARQLSPDSVYGRLAALEARLSNLEIGHSQTVKALFAIDQRIAALESESESKAAARLAYEREVLIQLERRHPAPMRFCSICDAPLLIEAQYLCGGGG